MNPDDLVFDRPEGMDLDTWADIKEQALQHLDRQVAELLDNDNAGPAPKVRHRLARNRVTYMCGKPRPSRLWGKPSAGDTGVGPVCKTCDVAYVHYLVTGVEPGH